MWSILEPYRPVLATERALLEDAMRFFDEIGGTAAEERLEGALEALERPFLVVVAGEYNSGKSSLINALLQEEILAVGVLPTTDRITLIAHGEDRGKRALDDHVLEIHHPSKILKELNLVDTPGTNSLERHHQRLSEDFIPNADLILFVTSTDRPLSESEREFLDLIGGRWKRALALCLNKIDLTSEDAREQIVEYLRTQMAKIAGEAIRIFPVSARQALEGGDAAKGSGLDALERYVLDELGDKAKVVLKLRGPIEVLEELLSDHVVTLDAQEEDLREETRGLEHVLANVRERSKEILERHVRGLDRIDGILDRIRLKSHEFLDESITLGALIRYRFTGSFEEDFKKHLLSEGRLGDRLDEVLADTIGELVRESRMLWSDAIAFVDEQIREHERRSKLVGGSSGVWMDRRREVRLGLKSAIDANLADFNIELEASRIQQSAGKSLAGFVGLNLVGVGTGAAAVLSAALHDITGIALGIVLAGLGFFVVPARRKAAKEEIGKRLDQLGRSLKDALEHELETAVGRTGADVERALDPYTSLCRAERERLERERETVEAYRKRSLDLRVSLE